MREAYFKRDGDAFMGQPHAGSTWGPNMLGGRALSGLVAHAAEHAAGDSAFVPARLTVDMFRAAPLGPLTVETEVVRDGNRIRVCDVTVIAEHGVVARCNAVFLRRGEDPPGTVWEPDPWDVPHPATLPSESDWPPEAGDVRVLSSWHGNEQRRIWFREAGELVEGEPMTPFIRVAMIADIANPMGNMSEQGLGFINADLTLTIARLPSDEWVGCESAFHTHADGVAVGGIALYDPEGRLGWSMVVALADRRSMEFRQMMDEAADPPD